MVNSTFKLLKTLKSASSMGASRNSFMPPEPLPNSIKAKQLEAQQLLADQTEEASVNSEGQLMDMQKAQQDAVNQYQQAQQEIQKLQGELQNAQSTSQQQAAAAQMDAQQQIQKAQAEAQAAIQEEKIKSQMKVLSMQEKYTKMQSSAKPNQNHILSNQLKRVTKKVQSLSKIAKTIDIEVELLSSKKANTVPPAAPEVMEQQRWATPEPTTQAVNDQQWSAMSPAQQNAYRQSRSHAVKQQAADTVMPKQPSNYEAGMANLNRFANNPLQYNADNPNQLDTAMNWDPDQHNMITNGIQSLGSGIVNSFTRMGSNLLGAGNQVARAGGELRDGAGTAWNNLASEVKGYGGQLLATSKNEREKYWNDMNSEIASRGPGGHMGRALGHLGTGFKAMGSGALEAGSWAFGGGAGWAATAPLRAGMARFAPGMIGKAVGFGASMAPSMAAGSLADGMAPQMSQPNAAAAPYTTHVPSATPNDAPDLNAAAQGFNNWKGGSFDKTVPATGTLVSGKNPNDYKLEKRVKEGPMNIMQNTGYMGHNPERMATNFLAPQSQGYGQIGDFIANILYRNVIPGLMPQPDIPRFQKSLYAPTNSYMHTP